MKAAQEAIGRWPSILPALGVPQSHLKNKHNPCPICARRSGVANVKPFRFDDRWGKGTWICSHCGAGSGFDLLMKYHDWNFATAARNVEKIIGVCPVSEVKTETIDFKARQDYIRKIWGEAQDPRIVRSYLEGRGLTGPFPLSLRGHPNLGLKDDGKSYPAMLALIWSSEGKVVGIHRTYLLGRGKKIRKMLKCAWSTKGAAIRLHDIPKLRDGRKVMGVAEGIETALAAREVSKGLPVWALISAGSMEAWESPEDVTGVSIFGDSDESYTGQAAAYALAKKLKSKGVYVEVQLPTGGDFLDLLQGRNAA